MAFEDPDERQQALIILRMASLTAAVGGRPFDDELQGLIDRAEEGDERIDLEDLMRRATEELPDASAADPTTWTFDEGLRASCEHFSIAIPDGYRVISDYEESGLLSMTRPFVAVPASVEDKDIPNADRLVCGAMPAPELDDFAEHGIDELAIMMMRGSANADSFGSPKVPEDWVVRGKNCDVLITRVDNGCTGYEYWIRPAILQLGHYVRCVFSNSDADQAEAARDALTAMAQSVEATPPIESELTRQLERICSHRVASEEFVEAVTHLHAVLKICLDRNHEANRTQYLRNTEHPNDYDLTKACVLGLEAFLNRVWPLVVRLNKALLFQQKAGASKAELAAESDAVGDAFTVFLVNYLADSRGSAEFLREHGGVARPHNYPPFLSTGAQFLKGKYDEVLQIMRQNEEELQESIRQHINDPEDGTRPTCDEIPQDEGDLGDDDSACDEADAEACDEPGGVDYPALVMTLLSDDWIFFEDDEITWDGRHHAIAGAQLNGAKVDGLLDFVNGCIPGFEDCREVFQYFSAFLNEIEKDEGLIVPRGMIAPGVQQAIREGDLTGLTLANLAACAKALSVEKVKPGAYRVIFDGRLIAGIPRFLDLVARLVWDLRQCTNSLRGKPFSLTFLQARNIDADHYLGNVDVPVPGTQEYAMFMEVSEPPVIQLPNASDASAYQEQAAVELSPEDDMALTSVYALVRDFPCTMPISGTHHMGRAARIEHIKVGDELILAADWNCPFFDPVGIEVFNAQGETLGYLEAGFGPMRGALALILPHVTATVESVTPLSKRRKGSKHALMDMHMELDDDSTVEGIWNIDPSDGLLSDARGIACRPKDERTVMSHASIDISQLKGRIDVSRFANGDARSSCARDDSHQETGGASDSAPAKEAAGDPAHDDAEQRQAIERQKQAEREARERAEREQAERERAAREERERIERERAEKERAEQERLRAEERARAEHAARIADIKTRVSTHRAGIAKAALEAETKRRALDSMRENDSIPRPRVRTALYQIYTLELIIDRETTELNELLLGLSEADAREAGVEELASTAFEGPLLPSATQALERHHDFCRKIAQGKSGDKREPFSDPLYGRILEHVIETGGGLGAGTIRHDAEATKNVFWTPIDQQADLNIDEALAFLDDPVHEMLARYRRIDPHRELDPSDIAIRKYKDQACINMTDGLIYLWFQLTPDVVSQLHYRRMLMEEAQGAVEASEAIQRKITAYEELVTSLREELEALGMLSFSRKSAINQRLSECEDELERLRTEYDRLHLIALDLDHRIDVYRKKRGEFYLAQYVDGFDLDQRSSQSVEG